MGHFQKVDIEVFTFTIVFACITVLYSYKSYRTTMWMVYTQHNKSELISSCATASTINYNLLNETVEQRSNYVKYNSKYVLFHILNSFKVDKFLINVCTSTLKS